MSTTRATRRRSIPAEAPCRSAYARGRPQGFVNGNGDPLDGELEREAEGEFRRTKTVTQDWGATLQLSYKGKILGRGNRVTVGVAYDGHQSRFTQSEAEANLVPVGNSVRVVRAAALRDGPWTSGPTSRTSASTSPTPSTSPTGWPSRWACAIRT